MGGLIMEATESLEPLLGLSAAFARDLQSDFLPFFPRLMQRLARLISSGGILLSISLSPMLSLRNHMSRDIRYTCMLRRASSWHWIQ